MEKRILTEEQKNAYDMIAIRKWAVDYTYKHKRDPTRAEIFTFIQSLHERAIVNINTDLADLHEEENEIREMARDICIVQRVPFDHIRIILAPNPSWTFRVQGGTPSEIILGIRRKTQGFKMILAEGIRKAGKLYRPSMLIPMSKVLEYRHETKKYTRKDENTEHYPLPDVFRLRVKEIRTLEVWDTKTNEHVRIEKEESTTGFQHHLNDRLAHEGRLVLARQMLAKGLIEFTKEEE